MECPSVCRRHGGHLPVEGAARSRLGGAIHHDSKIQVEVEPGEVRVRVEAAKFLEFLLTERGIEANLEKCIAIIAMRRCSS